MARFHFEGPMNDFYSSTSGPSSKFGYNDELLKSKTKYSVEFRNIIESIDDREIKVLIQSITEWLNISGGMDKSRLAECAEILNLAKNYNLAVQNNADAQAFLSFEYISGKLLVNNDLLALRWASKSAINGSAVSLRVLGIFFEYGGKGISINFVKARALYLIASRLGSKSAADSILEISKKMNSDSILFSEKMASKFKVSEILGT